MAHWNPLDRLKASQGQPKPVAVATVKPAPGTPVVGDLGQYQAAIKAAISAMAPMDTMKDRAEYKSKFLPSILPWVSQYVESGAVYPNSVAVQAMIWLFDIGDIEAGLRLGLYLIGQQVHLMPERFDRDMPTFICDSVYDWARAKLEEKQPASPYLGHLIDALHGDGRRWDLHPAVRGKMFVMGAKHAELAGEFEAGIALCNEAVQVNPTGAGVKTLLDRLQKAATNKNAA